jgi:hypothetical protein
MNNSSMAFLRELVHILLNPLNSLLIMILAGLITVFRVAMHFYERSKVYSLKEARAFYVVAFVTCSGLSIVEYLVLGNSIETWRSIALLVLVTLGSCLGHLTAIIIIQFLPDPLQKIEDFINRKIHKKVIANDLGSEEKTVAVIMNVINENKETVKHIIGML